ncbi:hypothetical protein BHE74_00023346 [Ensete ventricosum]|nr:hypothetical protein BHE74_00023346 [Ensete ventricosum]
MVPQPLVLPQPLFIARRLPSLPPVADFPTVITPQQLLQPPYRYQLLPPWPLLPLLPLPFPSFVHHNLTLLFITRRSSITARTMLSASPFDAIVVSISSLLPHTSSTPLLLLCCQCLVLASYRQMAVGDLYWQHLCSKRSLLAATKEDGSEISLLAMIKVDGYERSLLAATKEDGSERSLLATTKEDGSIVQ